MADPASLIPSVGASGAISAVMGTYLVLFPRSKVKLIFILFFSRFELPAIVFLGLWFIQQLLSGLGTLNLEQSGGIAWWAHIGGFLFGLLAGVVIKNKYGHLYRYGH
jgi:membrane associated rhomboid family serine protease